MQDHGRRGGRSLARGGVAFASARMACVSSKLPSAPRSNGSTMTTASVFTGQMDVWEGLDGRLRLLPPDLRMEARLVDCKHDEPLTPAVEHVRWQKRLVRGRRVDEAFLGQRSRPVLASLGRRLPLQPLGDVSDQLPRALGRTRWPAPQGA